eukprot:Nk52_evm25s292 gene=Nk52_evmTU25s292
MDSNGGEIAMDGGDQENETASVGNGDMELADANTEGAPVYDMDRNLHQVDVTLVGLSALPNVEGLHDQSQNNLLLVNNEESGESEDSLDLVNINSYFDPASTDEDEGGSDFDSEYDEDDDGEDESGSEEENANGDEAIGRPWGTYGVSVFAMDDIQGINWERLAFNREEYRESRIKRYQSYQNLKDYSSSDMKQIVNSHIDPCCNAAKVFKSDTYGKQRSGVLNDRKKYFNFHDSVRPSPSSIVHFQLRHLLWCSSSDSVYWTSKGKVHCWHPLVHCDEVVTNTRVIGSSGRGGFEITSMCANETFLALGGFYGDIYVQRSTDCVRKAAQGYESLFRREKADNGIINYVELVSNSQHTSLFAASNNNKILQYSIAESYNEEENSSLSLQKGPEYQMNYAVNCLSINREKKLICVCGDSKDSVVMDMKTGAEIFKLKGHRDYAFACAWSPNGNEVATGNQDKTLRVYDIRFIKPNNIDKNDGCIAILGAQMGAVRSVRYSRDGKYLAFAEPADFVHIFKTDAGYTECQTIDFFSEISGFDFSPDTQSLYIGLSDTLFGGILHYRRPAPLF